MHTSTYELMQENGNENTKAQTITMHYSFDSKVSQALDILYIKRWQRSPQQFPHLL